MQLTSDAERNVESLLGLPHARVLSEQEGFWDVYRGVTRGLAVRDNAVPDAHLAALLRQHDVPTLHTNDRDFHKFGFLKVRNPFDAKRRSLTRGGGVPEDRPLRSNGPAGAGVEE